METRTPKTLQEAVVYYSDIENCVQLMIRLRWADGVICPRCQSKEVTRIKMHPLWQCRSCRKQFTPKVGTIMEDSPIGLDKWLMAIWMLTNCKNGVSSMEIHRAIGVTQKTAWFMLHRIRYALNNGTIEKMTGIVEADETYIGGKEINKHKCKRIKAGGGTVGKAAVMGLLERGGGVVTKSIPDNTGQTIKPEVRAHVTPGTTLYTDTHGAYNGLGSEYAHEIVNHAVEYVRDNVHTNGIENFCSLLKRTIKGTYVAIDVPHLDSYLAEQAFRYNHRKADDTSRFLYATASTPGKRLTYKDLTGRNTN